MDCQSRRRKSSFSDEDELRRMSRVWIQDADKDALLFQGMNLQQHQPLQQQVPPVVVADHHMIRLQQQRANEMATTPSVPLSLQQRAMAAIALQEIRSSIDPKHNLLHQQQVQQNQSPLLATHNHQLQGLKYPQHHHVHHQQQQQLKALQHHLQQQMPGNALLERRYPLQQQHQASPEADPTKLPASPQLIIPPVMFPSSLSGISSAAAALPSSSPGVHTTKPNPICPNIVTDLQQQQQQQQPKCSPSSSSRPWFSSSSLDLPQPSLRSSGGHVLPAAMFPHGLSGEFSERSGAAGGSVILEQQEQVQCDKASTGLQGLSGFGAPNALPLSKPTSTNLIPPCYNQASNINSSGSSSSKRLISSCNLEQVFTDLKNVASPAAAAAGECATTDNVVENRQKTSNNSSASQHEQQQQQQQQRQPMRTYTKVYKLGSIGRAIDVARFKNYVELCAELSRMFGLDGQLDQKNGWQLVFVDKENDLLLVGDDPWEEFVNSVRGIRILSPSEVSYYTSDERVDVV